MEIRPHQNSRPGFQLDLDFISFLPVELILEILVRLPIKKAIRTSILSSKWKYLWTSIPDLVIKDNTRFKSELIRFVDMVLLVHQGHIRTFELDCKPGCNEAINRWLLILSQNGIKDLRLCFDEDSYCIMTSSLFSCHKLEHLEITNCGIYGPQCFQGLKFLCTLRLSAYFLLGITLEKLVLNCPLLESLKISEFYQHDCLVIRAPNLRRLNIIGVFPDISLETPKLISASIILESFYGLMNDGCESKILHVLSRLPNIEELEICSMFSMYLGLGPIPKKLPLTYHCLRKIVINLKGRYKKGVEVALCIFRSAPNLKTLYIRVPSQNIWDEQRMTKEVWFKHLEIGKILGFEDAMSMLGFVKFLLSTAPNLEKLIIYEDDIRKLDDGLAFVMKLSSFSRLSSKAVILFCRSSSD